MKKNVPNLRRVRRDDEGDQQPPLSAAAPDGSTRSINGHPNLGLDDDDDATDVEAVHRDGTSAHQTNGQEHQSTQYVHAKPANVSLSKILEQYGKSITASALMGSFSPTPTIAAAPTMYLVSQYKTIDWIYQELQDLM